MSYLQDKKTDKELSGKRLKEIRKLLKQSQTELASNCGLVQGNVSDAERGNRDIPRDVLFILASQYKINLNWLLIGEGEMFVPTQEPEDGGMLKELVKTQKKLIISLEAELAHLRGRTFEVEGLTVEDLPEAARPGDHLFGPTQTKDKD